MIFRIVATLLVAMDMVGAFSFENLIEPLLSGADDEGFHLGDYLSRETADSASRLFLSYINSTTTISASYAMVIILGLSFVLLGVLGLAYLAASAVFTGTSVQSYYGKRSIPDSEDEAVEYKWARILEILDQMEEHFQRLGVHQKEDDDCRKNIICQVASAVNTTDLNDEHRRIAKLTKDLSDIYEKEIAASTGGSIQSTPLMEKMTAYYQANQRGRKQEGCDVAYSKCIST